MDVRLIGGPCDGWTVPWPEGRIQEHFLVPADRPLEPASGPHLYQLQGDGEAHYVKPLTKADADALERRIAADIGVELKPMSDEELRRGLGMEED